MKGVPNTKYIGYRKNMGNYYIQKRVKDKIFLFGTYETLEDFFGSGIKELNPSTFLCKDIELIWNNDTKGAK